ncbi:hypothetical protein FOE78_07815 [Microlunatus elymi]|uniref:Uncharacterized protein n=1 Tax=Microlunatus elymi TaxID=2596828 RepID=A0A516PXC2_9ACTN|nr:hypothetical protein [Microlunatus elymi]QDP95818.1 hypothetical protein FOE78_07815 [Microlunatus elymi]
MLSIVLSVLALVGTAASITWQVVSWHLTGPRLKVSATWGVAGRRDRPDLPALYLMIEVANIGRAETTIHTLGYLTPDNSQLVELQCALQGQVLPRRLAPGDALTFFYDLERMQHSLRHNDIHGELRPYVRSGHGRRVGRSRYTAAEVVKLER